MEDGNFYARRVGGGEVSDLVGDWPQQIILTLHDRVPKPAKKKFTPRHVVRPHVVRSDDGVHLLTCCDELRPRDDDDDDGGDLKERAAVTKIKIRCPRSKELGREGQRGGGGEGGGYCLCA